MSENMHCTSLNVRGERRDFAVTGPSAHDYAMLEELSFVRREAQAEAVDAYEDWRDIPSDERWWVYQAAQERADAAQDELADWARALAV